MFKFVVMCALLATAAAQHRAFGSSHASAAGQNSDDGHAEILKLESDVNEHGFHYVYETSNNIKAVAEGDESGSVRGDFQWISPEGQHVQVNYVADETGYQPQSDVLPTPHPIPEAILRSLEYIASHPPLEVTGRRV